MDYIDTRWFISYKTYSFPPKENLVVTDVTPARWVMYRSIGTGDKCIVLYAEEISPALAVELTHVEGIETDYFKKDD